MNTQPEPAAACSRVDHLPLLSQAECQSVIARLEKLENRWTRRHFVWPFFTLGAASYLDAVHSRKAYEQRAARLNPLLREYFASVLEALQATLAMHLGAPVDWHPKAAVPGFHIYLAHPDFCRPIASIHCDTQYQLVDWSDWDSIDLDYPLSFTLPIALPGRGGGLNLWDIHYDEIKHFDPEIIKRLVNQRRMQYQPYMTGQLVLHSGHRMHQIAPASKLLPGDRRVTLQGHCVRAGNTWYLYW